MAHPYIGKLFSNKKEWTIDWYILLHAKWKKPDTSDDTLYDYVYKNVLNRQKYRDKQ